MSPIKRTAWEANGLQDGTGLQLENTGQSFQVISLCGTVKSGCSLFLIHLLLNSIFLFSIFLLLAAQVKALTPVAKI